MRFQSHFWKQFFSHIFQNYAFSVHSHIGCLHGNDNGGVFKNLHFETRFQNYAFSVNEQVKRIKSFLFLAENVVV